MDLNSTLTKITIICGAGTFIGAVASQFWKSSIEIDGRLTKRLTPAGWLSLGIAMVSLAGSIASELIRVSIQNTQQVQAKAEAAQKEALQQQETRWRTDTTNLLAVTKSDIETNLGDTLSGFQKEQESDLAHMHQIIVAGQPLTSLTIHWSFSTNDPSLWQIMHEAQKAIKENSESEQGGVPLVPLDAEEYQVSLLPLISFIAKIGGQSKAAKSYEVMRSYAPGAAKEATLGAVEKSIVTLIPLDDSPNAMLSFGSIGDKSIWWNKEGTAKLSAGFAPTNPDTRLADASPRVTPLLSKESRGLSTYVIDWTLDSATLDGSIDRTNLAVSATGKLPDTLKVTILYDMVDIPFRQNNFGYSYAVDLWGNNGYARRYLTYGDEIGKMSLTIGINGFENKRYILNRIYDLELQQADDDDFGVACTVLEFKVIQIAL